MKKEIFTEKTKNTDTSNQKIKISIFSGIIVIILVFFVGGLFLFAARMAPGALHERTPPFALTSPDAGTIIKSIIVYISYTF